MRMVSEVPACQVPLSLTSWQLEQEEEVDDGTEVTWGS